LCADGSVAGVARFWGLADNVIEKEVVIGLVSDGANDVVVGPGGGFSSSACAKSF